MSTLQELIHRHLHGVAQEGPTHIITGSDAATRGAQACAFAGAGLDLHRGEHTLAAVRMHMEPRGATHLVVLALTNTRAVLGGFASIKNERNAIAASVHYDQIAQVKFEKSFIKGATLELLTQAGAVSLMEVYRDALGAFFQDLGAIPAGSRGQPGVDALRPSTDDPSGALTVRAELWTPDPLVEDVLERVHQAVTQGGLAPAAGLDLTGRAVVAHRAQLQGPGGFADGFASAATSAALPSIIAELLGPPVGGQQGPDGTHYVDFAVPQAQGLPPALAALGIASFVGLGVGFSPGRMIASQMLAKPPLTGIRLVARDASGATYYALFNTNTGQPLHHSEAMWAHGIHQLIAHHGPTSLQRHVAQLAG